MTNQIHVPGWCYRRSLENARALRREQTLSEHLLWEEVRHRRLAGLKFRRQQPIGPFVVDFYCQERRLIVEIDGPVHDRQQTEDERRQQFLEELGLHFVRIKSSEVENDLPTALARILAAVE